MTDEQKRLDRDLARESGLSEQEAECWVAVAEAAAQYLQLPPPHVSQMAFNQDIQEAVQAFHVIQDKLMRRPAYARYLAAVQARGLAAPGAGNS